MIDQAQRLRELIKGEQGNIKESKEIPHIKNGKIITIASGKGGVGKSNIVVNLAIALSNMGNKVLIFDADMGMSNDHLLIGQNPRYNVFDIVERGMDINEVVLEGPCGIHLISGGTALDKIDTLEEKERETFLKKMYDLKDYDFVLIDTGAGVNKNILSFIACSDEFIVVTTPEPTSLTDAYSLVKVIRHFEIKNSAHIIINKVFDKREGTLTYERFSSAVKNFLGMDTKLLGYIYEDRKLVESVRGQIPVYINYPNSNFSLCIKSISKKLMKSMEIEKEEAGMHGFFKKLFNLFS
ncbi:MinD/ParA family protein [Hathewaya massiliensis]|uniref:MinD/ParA family protein n=1 Tax=Hathewaya massiliensis TaxID=1964382 RepID=UPI0011593583|nr:MinD/ParA family protein [Hathewaya massiliensis]